ncbi:fasciclin-like arabinogalactan protein 20 [Pyrus ussuriensis x Pyrus communis]|uniref:Fasciclin-like arabinogalactan protein 20 n=1 Tax=Pyrus ussuriensis x Pyrus communis TaxID=2448454 RepID=A0A5N5FJ70_9ROSA|nr:fasciclin-like arabinogalactan protein 20 [Pyrus ussuriensis x Pyrus communis]KAB2634400.1 fasciclin-like arabinogalactan protein 20 [Pyrus ussuriensis x Pyrus communis]
MWIVKTQNPATFTRIHPTSVSDPVCRSSSPPTSANNNWAGSHGIQSVYPNAFKSVPRVASVKSKNWSVGVGVWS